ncbi:Hypothetical predicted protein [Pelobates cultripes]|uniref:Uncharacterized protein n=1 Tax=Pelobates cultripes TaxID=61616 RepID=A0AAD1RG86_PELCU|nr:Hypothetical predicted protein [Pelobates cultripes]
MTIITHYGGHSAQSDIPFNTAETPASIYASLPGTKNSKAETPSFPYWDTLLGGSLHESDTEATFQQLLPTTTTTQIMGWKSQKPLPGVVPDTREISTMLQRQPQTNIAVKEKVVMLASNDWPVNNGTPLS